MAMHGDVFAVAFFLACLASICILGFVTTSILTSIPTEGLQAQPVFYGTARPFFPNPSNCGNGDPRRLGVLRQAHSGGHGDSEPHEVRAGLPGCCDQSAPVAGVGGSGERVGLRFFL